jgi:hypothetical protein
MREMGMKRRDKAKKRAHEVSHETELLLTKKISEVIKTTKIGDVDSEKTENEV